MVKLEDVTEKVLMISLASGLLSLGIMTVRDSFVSNEVKTDYSTLYNGKPALVQHVDKRWNRDSYWILLNGKDKMSVGEITDDFGNKIYVNDDDSFMKYKVIPSKKYLSK